MEHKIGEIFCLEDGTMLEVAKSVCNCRDCYFFDSKDKDCSKSKNIESCFPPTREDKEFIIFKQVKDNNMEEKRNIQISLKEAKEWYNSGNSFKKELALKAYKEEELKLKTLDYWDISLSIATNEKERIKIYEKTYVYKKLMKVATYFNNIYSIKYDSNSRLPIYYIITKKWESATHTKHKDFFINKSVCKSIYEIAFNSEEAAKRAIDMLGEELNILFE